MALNMEDPYLKYYSHQAGSGISNVYRGASYQRGHGIGSFLGGLFRTVSPILRTVGKEALRSGVGLLGDVVYANPPREAFRKRAHEFTSNLKSRADTGIDKMMSGAGYKRRRRAAARQSVTRRCTKRKPKRGAGRVVKRRKTTRPARRRTVTRRRTAARRTTVRRRQTKRRDIFG